MYEKIKAAVSLKDAAESYGLTVSRNGMARCPFHDDHSPSLKLNEDYYYCFGCGEQGDVIDFTAKLFGKSRFWAAKKLELDFGLLKNSTGKKPVSRKKVSTPTYPNLAVFRNNEILCFRALAGYEEVLEDWTKQYKPTSPDAPIDERYAEACRMLPTVRYLLDCLTVASFEDRYAMVERLMEGDFIPRLRKYVTEELRKKYERHVS